MKLGRSGKHDYVWTDYRVNTYAILSNSIEENDGKVQVEKQPIESSGSRRQS